MRYANVQFVEKPVSRLVLGTMIVRMEDLERSMQLLDEAFELGCTTLDTAHVYGGGNSERAIGQWMKARKNREKMVIISKGCHHNVDRKRVTPFDLLADLHDSLTRLQTDYIDIYMLHRDNPEVPVGPIVEALNEQLEAGRIRAFGGSNWRHERLQEANDYASAHGLQPFVASSPHYSLAEQVNDPWGPGCVALSGPKESAAREWYKANRMPIFAYSSLARGFFSGRISRTAREQAGKILDAAALRAYCHDTNFDRLDRVEKLAEQKGMTVPQIAMAYIMNQPLNVFALVGAQNGGELQAAVEACELPLTAEETAWLDLRATQP